MPLIGFASDRCPPALWEAEVSPPPLAIAAVLMGAALLIIFVAGFSLGFSRADRVGSPELEPIDAVPAVDLPGRTSPACGATPAR